MFLEMKNDVAANDFNYDDGNFYFTRIGVRIQKLKQLAEDKSLTQIFKSHFLGC